jgi:hypothetical protein
LELPLFFCITLSLSMILLRFTLCLGLFKILDEMHGRVVQKVLESIVHRNQLRHIELKWRDRR